MNWFVNRYISAVTQRDIDRALDGCCEHIEIGKPAHTGGERDSFGPVTEFLNCPACHDAALAAEGEEETVCHDCQMTVKVKDTISWKWYDFYAPQGDEPLIICKDCQKKERHLERCRRDADDRYDELGY